MQLYVLYEFVTSRQAQPSKHKQLFRKCSLLPQLTVELVGECCQTHLLTHLPTHLLLLVADWAPRSYKQQPDIQQAYAEGSTPKHIYFVDDEAANCRTGASAVESDIHIVLASFLYLLFPAGLNMMTFSDIYTILTFTS